MLNFENLIMQMFQLLQITVRMGVQSGHGLQNAAHEGAALLAKEKITLNCLHNYICK